MKKLISIATVAILSLSLIGCQLQPKMGHGSVVVATNGNAVVYTRDVYYQLGQLFDSEIPSEAELLEEFEEGVTLHEKMLEVALERAKANALIAELARIEGLENSAEEIEYLQLALDTTVNGLASKERSGERAFYETYLVTSKEFFESAKIEFLANMYKQTFVEAIEITEDEIDETYKIYGPSYNEYTVAHILIGFDGNPELSEEELKEKAEAILLRAESGENFGELAETYSEDSGSSKNNGEYVIDIETPFVQEFKDWTFSAKVGDFGLVRTDYGFHIMHLVSIDMKDGAREDIRFDLQSQRAMPLLENILEEANDGWNVDQSVLKSISLNNFR